MAKLKNVPVDPWQAEDDSRILKRAHEIMNDAKRHEEAKKHATKEMEALKKITSSKAIKPAKKAEKKGK